jgi:hypothetical protein
MRKSLHIWLALIAPPSPPSPAKARCYEMHDFDDAASDLAFPAQTIENKCLQMLHHNISQRLNAPANAHRVVHNFAVGT